MKPCTCRGFSFLLGRSQGAELLGGRGSLCFSKGLGACGPCPGTDRPDALCSGPRFVLATSVPPSGGCVGTPQGAFNLHLTVSLSYKVLELLA